MTKFVVQLEYWLEGDWREVVRYDHDRDAPSGHDITNEGLHRDIYRDGKKIRPEEVSPPIPANEGFDAAEEIYERTSKNSSRGSKNGTG